MQANIFEKWYFLFQEYAFSLREHYPHFKILKCKFCSPLIEFFLLHTPFNPKSPKKSSPPHSARGDEGMIEGVRGTSIGVGRVVAYI